MKEIHQIISTLGVNNLCVVDIGASGGMWHYYEKFIGSKHVDIILLEPSKIHAKKLIDYYKHYHNVKVEAVGLYKSDCNKILNYADTGGASIYNYDQSVAENYVEYHNAGKPNIQTNIRLISAPTWLDKMGKNKSLMGVKLDTQGCELDILASANEFRELGFICTEAPFGHKYEEQGALSEFFRFFETNNYEIFDVVINHSCFVAEGNRKQFIQNIFQLLPNMKFTHSIFRPRAMDGDIYAVKKIDEGASQYDLIKRFFSFITLNYYVEAHSLVNELELSKSNKKLIKSKLINLIRRRATIKDRSPLIHFIYSSLGSSRGTALLKKLKILPDC